VINATSFVQPSARNSQASNFRTNPPTSNRRVNQPCSSTQPSQTRIFYPPQIRGDARKLRRELRPLFGPLQQRLQGLRFGVPLPELGLAPRNRTKRHCEPHTGAQNVLCKPQVFLEARQHTLGEGVELLGSCGLKSRNGNSSMTTEAKAVALLLQKATL
jgi:hypothetical protein